MFDLPINSVGCDEGDRLLGDGAKLIGGAA